MADQSVTTIVHHYIKADKDEEFRSWLKETREESKNYSGYIDSNLLEREQTKDGDFISIFRFDTYQNLKTWVDSEVHQRQMDKLQELSFNEAKLQSYEGLEFWFDRVSGDRVSASTFKMSVVTFIGLLPLVLIIPPLYEKLTGTTGLLSISISTAITVLLMSYVVMPILNKAFKRFL